MSESDSDQSSIVSSLYDKEETSEENEEYIKDDVQTALNSFLDPGDIRAHFVIDEGPLAEELISNNYKHALNYCGYDLQRKAERILDHKKNKELPEALNKEEIMAVLLYTSVATGTNVCTVKHKNL